jgi:hypothetical protein
MVVEQRQDPLGRGKDRYGLEQGSFFVSAKKNTHKKNTHNHNHVTGNIYL